MRNYVVLFFLALALGALGCTGGHRRHSVTDGGTPPPPPSDGGNHIDSPIVLPDSGFPPPPVDSGFPPPPVDSGFPPPPTDAGTSCSAPLAPFPAADAPRCTSTTSSCLAGCTDQTCVTSCLSSDTTTPLTASDGTSIDCTYCWQYQQIYCVDSSGCHSQVAAYFCCAQELCGSSSDSSCPSTMCSSQLDALNTCASSSASSCLSNITGGDYAVCFP